MALPTDEVEAIRNEARTGLEPWKSGDLPLPPVAKGFSLLGVIGPGAIILGASIGSGEWLLGPAVFVKHGLSLLWVTALAITLQTIFNTEVMRYTLYTGEPVITGFMRTRPHSTFWAWVYAGLFFLQYGWPGWAGSAAGAIFFLITKRMATAADATTVYYIGVGTFLVCVVILIFSGRRIERTLEILNWILIVGILGTMIMLCLAFAGFDHWVATVVGFVGIDLRSKTFDFIPSGVDWFLIGAFASYSGLGGAGNLTVSNYARDKGFGMGQVVGYIPAAVGGRKVKLAHVGTTFTVSEHTLERWRGWWRIISADQWGVFCIGAFLGMALPAILYTAIIDPGKEIRGLAVAAELALAMVTRGGPVIGFLVAFMSVWVLFKTQLDIMEATVRSITDIIWSGSARVRAWREGDVRIIYYSVMVLFVVWGLIALRLSQPIILLQLGANVAGLIFIIGSLHILYVNTKLLPKELRPPLWRRLALVFMAVFYAFFAYLWLMGGLVPNPEKGFLFNILKHLGGG